MTGRADREAVVLKDLSLGSSKNKRLYTYIGHGQLTAGSSQLVTGVAITAKERSVAASACAAVAVLTACCPGDPVLLEPELVITGGELCLPRQALVRNKSEVEARELLGQMRRDFAKVLTGRASPGLAPS